MRRQRLLIVGCGDVGVRVVRELIPAPGRSSEATGRSGTAMARMTVRALTSNPDRMAELRALGVTPLLGDLDQPASLARLGALASWVLHLAPPPATGEGDPRSLALARAALRARGRSQSRRALLAGLPPFGRLRRLALRGHAGGWRVLVYGSTTGVYGDCQGDWVSETRPVNPRSPRAKRRVQAERTLRRLARQSHWAVRVSGLRIPGIYAPDRSRDSLHERLRRGTPSLAPADDVFTNHIHADDLARAALRALALGRPQRTVNVCDDTVMKAGDYFDLAADLYGLPRPPRLPAAELQAQVSHMQWSFLRESRRLRNARLKRELKLRLRHPHVRQGLMD
jgi:nucleoside-diphosphate-sugar epimerase